MSEGVEKFEETWHKVKCRQTALTKQQSHLRLNLFSGSQRLEREPERKVRGRSEEGDQEAAKVERSDQNMDRVGQHQRQIRASREEETHRTGKLVRLQKKIFCFS